MSDHKSALSSWPDLLASLIGNRTRMAAVAAFIAAAAARWGLDMDPALLVEILMVGLPVLMLIMRQITHTPAGATEPAPMVIGHTSKYTPIVARTPANSPTIVQAEVSPRSVTILQVYPVLGTSQLVESTQYPGSSVQVEEVQLAPMSEFAQGGG